MSLVERILGDLGQSMKLEGKYSLKLPERIQAKASRPSIRSEKPWHDIEHVRDGLRFKVNKALESAGGRWDRSTKTHLFAGDPSVALGLKEAPAAKTSPKSETPANYPGKGLAPAMASLGSSAESVRSYLDSNGTKPEAAAKESERVSAALAQNRPNRVGEFGTAYSQADLFGGVGTIENPEKLGRQVATHAAAAMSRAKARAGRDAVSQDLISGLQGNWEALAREVNSKGRASAILPDLIDRKIPAWTLVGTKIETPEDVHALMLPLRSPYFESLKVMVLDGNNNVVHAQILTVGSVAESTAHPADIFGVLARLRETTGKKHTNIIISHNHPSGDPSPSRADEQITRRLQNLADLTGWNVVDHVVTNGDKYYSFRESGQVGGADKAEKAYTPKNDTGKNARNLLLG